MRSTEDSPATRERIRDAAIRRFAADGLNASLRSIAAAANVSAPLILHYFGSRDGLLAACDDYITSEVIAAKSSVLHPLSGPAALHAQNSQIGQYAPIVGYVIRLLQAGGTRRNQIIDRLSESAETYLAEAEAAGILKPSRDPVARARFLTMQGLGHLMLAMIDNNGTIDIEGLPQRLEQTYADLIGPMLEVYTHGLLTDATLLDTHLSAHVASAST